MKLIINAMTIVFFISITGCNKNEEPVKAADSAALKAPLEALEKSKQVNATVQDAAAQQREKIDEQAQ